MKRIQGIRKDSGRVYPESDIIPTTAKSSYEAFRIQDVVLLARSVSGGEAVGEVKMDAIDKNVALGRDDAGTAKGVDDAGKIR